MCLHENIKAVTSYKPKRRGAPNKIGVRQIKKLPAIAPLRQSFQPCAHRATPGKTGQYRQAPASDPVKLRAVNPILAIESLHLTVPTPQKRLSGQTFLLPVCCSTRDFSL